MEVQGGGVERKGPVWNGVLAVMMVAGVVRAAVAAVGGQVCRDDGPVAGLSGCGARGLVACRSAVGIVGGNVEGVEQGPVANGNGVCFMVHDACRGAEPDFDGQRCGGCGEE